MTNNKRTQYSLRKLSIGLASVAIGMGVVGSIHHGDVVKAEVVGQSSASNDDLDTRLPNIRGNFMEYNNHANSVSFYSDTAVKYILQDSMGKRLGIFNTSNPSDHHIDYNFKTPMPIDTSITATPIDIRGVEGKPLTIYYTDKTKLLEARTVYGDMLGVPDHGIFATPLFKNASAQAQEEYRKANQQANNEAYQDDIPQAKRDEIAANLKTAYENLSKDNIGKDTRLPNIRGNFREYNNHANSVSFYSDTAVKYILQDSMGKRLGIFNTSNPSDHHIDYNFKTPMPIDTSITATPIDIRGVEGKPLTIYYTDKTKLLEARTVYGDMLGVPDHGIFATPLFKNASAQAQEEYRKANQQANNEAYQDDIPQAKRDEIAANLKTAYENLYKDRITNTDDTGNNIETTPTVPSDNHKQNVNIPNTDNKLKNKVSETSFSTVVYAPVINNNPNYMIALRDKDGRLTGKYISTNSRWKVFAKKIINGEIFYRLGTQNQWVPAKYLSNNVIDEENNAERPLKAVGYVAILHNNRNYKVALYSSTGKLTGYLGTNSNWKVLAKKTINGVLMYRLGNQNQWLPAKYIKLR